MRRALILISARQWRSHKLLALITLFSVSIGVATFFAMQTANQSLLNSVESSINGLAGNATLQITAGESGFSEDVLETVRRTPGVIQATAVLEVFCKTNLEDQQKLIIFGIDPEAELKLDRYKLTNSESYIGQNSLIESLRQPDAIMVSSTFARQEYLSAGDTLPVLTPRGKRNLTIRSVFKDEGIALFYGGHIGIMDIHLAQEVFGRGGNVDRIDIVTDPNTIIDPVQTRLKEQLPAGLQVERPQWRAKQVEDATVMVRHGFLLTSMVALLISCFLIFNAISMAVHQRWREIGVLRALGVEQHNIRKIFLGEAGVIGLVGSVLGIIIGYYMAVELSGLALHLTPPVSSALPSIIANPQPPRFSLLLAFESISIGIVASLISAWLPARAASRLSPVLALHNIEIRQQELVVGWPRVAAGVILLVIGLALMRFTTPLIGLSFQLSFVAFTFFGLVIMLPKLTGWFARLLRPLVNRALGAEAVLAIDSLSHAPRRTSATVAALMTCLAFVFSTSAFIQSQKAVVTSSFERGINSDLVAWTDSSMTEAMATRIASIAGISSVNRIIFTTTPYHGQAVGLNASDVTTWLARPGPGFVAGDLATARALVGKGEGVLVSDIFASRWGFKVGDVLRLESPTATVERPVLGIIENKTWLRGIIYLDRSLYKDYWHDERVGWLAINLSEGADPIAMKSTIQRITSNDQLIFVETAAEEKVRLRQIVSREIDRLFGLVYVQMFIASFVAVIGIANTLIMAVWDRKQEIGIIRAIGGTRRQVVRLVLIEAGLIAAMGLMTGIIKGSFDIYFMIRTVAVAFGGYSIPFYFPFALILLTAPVITVISLIAAWWPARLASETDVLAAIGSE